MEQSGGRSRVLCWELVGLVCFAGGCTSKQGKPNKGNQTRETKGNQTRETKEKPRETKETKKTPSINKRNTFQSMGVSSINRIPF